MLLFISYLVSYFAFYHLMAPFVIHTAYLWRENEKQKTMIDYKNKSPLSMPDIDVVIYSTLKAPFPFLISFVVVMLMLKF